MSASARPKKPKAPWCWQEKNNLRAIRALVKQGRIKKSEGRNMLDIFRAITEMISDASGQEIITGPNLVKRIGGYALIGPDNVKRTLNLMADHGLIRVSKVRNSEGRYISSQIELLPPPQRRGPAPRFHSGAGRISTDEILHGGQNRPLIEKNFEFKEESFQSKKSDSISEKENLGDAQKQTESGALSERAVTLSGLGEGPVAAHDLQSANLIEVIAYFNRAAGLHLDPQRVFADPVWDRLQEGASVEEAMLVIDHRVALWGESCNMRDNIRPSTLFSRERFWEYLELARRWHADGRPRLERGRDQQGIALLHPDGQARDELLEEWKERTRT